MEVANDGATDYQAVHKFIGKIVQTNLPLFFSDYRSPWMVPAELKSS
jgi:hypothetical protein